MLMKAIEVGVFCLERGRTAQDTDFVKRKMTQLLSQVEQAVVDIPARTEKNLLRQIGADDGQVLSPVKKLVNEASSETARPRSCSGDMYGYVPGTPPDPVR